MIGPPRGGAGTAYLWPRRLRELESLSSGTPKPCKSNLPGMTKWQPAGEDSMQAVKNQNAATSDMRLEVGN
jgi:hypothetical protein